MLEMLARARSRLRPKLRAHAHARSYSGFQCSYSLGAQDFGARPIPKTFYAVQKSIDDTEPSTQHENVIAANNFRS